MAAETWLFSIGNAITRAAADPVASGSSEEDPVHPLSELGSGLPDNFCRWLWNDAGVYGASVDLSMLHTSTPLSNAPTGWRDLLLELAGTPGLAELPPDWGSYGGRTALRCFRPVFQDVTVYPGETVRFACGLYRPSGSSVTAVSVLVVDLYTGRQWSSSWGTSGAAGSQSTADSWEDVAVQIAADTTRSELGRYRIILTATEAGDWDSGSYWYVSDPAIWPEVDLCAILHHGFGADATVEVDDGTVTWSPTWKVPTMQHRATSAANGRNWGIEVTLPSGLIAVAERPWIGELWLGTARELIAGLAFPMSVPITDKSGVRVKGGRGREYSANDGGRAQMSAKFAVQADVEQNAQVRDLILGATRYGTDPMLLIPPPTYDEVVWHGKVSDGTIDVKRGSWQLKGYGFGFLESPAPVV